MFVYVGLHIYIYTIHLPQRAWEWRYHSSKEQQLTSRYQFLLGEITCSRARTGKYKVSLEHVVSGVKEGIKE